MNLTLHQLTRNHYKQEQLQGLKSLNGRWLSSLEITFVQYGRMRGRDDGLLGERVVKLEA
jgi:hypothetical protein